MASSIFLPLAQVTTSPLSPASLGDLLGPWKYLIVLAVFAASIAGGVYLARAFRMQDHAWRIAVVLFSALVGTTIVLLGCIDRRADVNEKVQNEVVRVLNTPKPDKVDPADHEKVVHKKAVAIIEKNHGYHWGWRLPKLGIDLRGGVILVYEVDKSAAKGKSVDMDKLIAAVSRRINPGGQKEVTIRPYGFQQIEIIVPEIDPQEVERLKKRVGSIGTLEFRILATRKNETHARLMDIAKSGKDEDLAGLDAKWVPIVKGEENKYAASEFLTRKNARGETEILVILDRFHVVDGNNIGITGDYLTAAMPGTDQRGRPAVEFRFNSAGAQLFGALTSTHLPGAGSDNYHLGIILDGYLQSAPTIQSTITDSGEITGDFTKEEVDDLVGVLNAGSLPAALNKVPNSEQIIGPTLGADSIAKSKWALFGSVASVLAFMIVYYRFSGVVASVAVVVNIIMTVAAMIAIHAPFTLPGFAGLALTLGMAVDANVLIYERIREEMARGTSLRMAIRNGFSRAMSTIVDSNLTTLITAIVLYVIGTDQIKGFAVTLTLGIIISMYTAVFCSRVIFDVFERMRWITRLKMMQLIGVTHINFMGAFKYCVAGSMSIIILGLALAAYRGKGMLNIDFIGGTSVEALFNEPQPINQVREKVAKLPDVTVTDTAYSGEKQGLRFKLETSDPDVKRVQAELIEIFPNQLATNAVTFEVTAAGKKAKKESEKPAKKQTTTAQLKFKEKVNYDTLSHFFKEALGEKTFERVAPRFSNPNYTEGSSASFTDWTASIALPEGEVRELLAKIQQDAAKEPYFPSSNTIGGKVAGSTSEKAVFALVASMFFITLYLWVRFQKVMFGVAAVVALVHDVLITVAFLAFSYWLAPVFGFLLIDPFKLDLNVLAALLTIIGYSVNDTVVVFDRIREVRGKSLDMTRPMINASINQTLSRTILTSLTVVLVSFFLYAFGGTAIHGFAFSMLIGVITGTYSSIYIAAPLLLLISSPTRGPQSRKVAEAALAASNSAKNGLEPK